MSSELFKEWLDQEFPLSPPVARARDSGSHSATAGWNFTTTNHNVTATDFSVPSDFPSRQAPAVPQVPDSPRTNVGFSTIQQPNVDRSVNDSMFAVIDVMLSTLTEERRAFAEERRMEAEAHREEKRLDDEAREQRRNVLSTSNTTRILKAPTALDGSSTASDSIADRVALLRNYLSGIKLAKSEWVTAAQSYLTGHADKWFHFETLTTSDGTELCVNDPGMEWDDFEAALIVRFSDPSDDDNIWLDFTSCKQLHSAKSYVSTFHTHRTCVNSNPRLSNIDDGQAINFFMTGLMPNVRARLAIAVADRRELGIPYTLAQLTSRAILEDCSLNPSLQARQSGSTNPPPPCANGIQRKQGRGKPPGGKDKKPRCPLSAAVKEDRKAKGLC
eukprot:1971539-Rhodomonas_salina.1